MKKLKYIIFILLFHGNLGNSQDTIGINIDSLFGIEFQDLWQMDNFEFNFIEPSENIGGLFDYIKIDYENEGPIRTWDSPENADKYEFFPNAQICYTQEGLDLERFFRLDQDSSFIQIGAYFKIQNRDIYEYYIDPRIIAPKTFFYDSMYIDTITYQLIDNLDTSVVERYLRRSIISYGDVRIPSGLFQNCLIEQIERLDSLGVPISKDYSFYHQNLHNRILHLDMEDDTLNEIFAVLYRNPDLSPSSNVEVEQSNFVTSLYIHNQSINFSTTEKGKYQCYIFDRTGRNIFNKKINSVVGENRIQIESELCSDLYFISIIHKSGKFLTKKQFYNE